MFVVTRAVVGLAAIGGGLEFIGECCRPFLPGEMPLLGELDGERECLGLPGLGENRPILRRAAGAAALSRRSVPESGSGWLKVVVPQIDIDGILRRGLLAPQLARGEAHRVDMLRLLAEEMGVGVWENKDAVVAVDRAELAARIARQARMVDGFMLRARTRWPTWKRGTPAHLGLRVRPAHQRRDLLRRERAAWLWAIRTPGFRSRAPRA